MPDEAERDCRNHVLGPVRARPGRYFYNIYPQIKLGIVFAVFIIGIAIYNFWRQRKKGERDSESTARPPEAIANLVWLLIAGFLIAVANIVPQFNGAPGFFLAALGVGIIFYRFWRQGSQKRREKRLIFGRFSSKQLGTAAGILLIVNFFVIMLIAKSVENASRQTIFIVLISAAFALSAPVGILFGAIIYNMAKQDQG